jgi:ammonium transporter, Amt family
MVRSKNVINVLFQNILQAAVGAAAWYLIGFAVAYGDDSHHFIGTTFFGLQNVNEVTFLVY